MAGKVGEEWGRVGCLMTNSGWKGGGRVGKGWVSHDQQWLEGWGKSFSRPNVLLCSECPCPVLLCGSCCSQTCLGIKRSKDWGIIVISLEV